MDDATQDGETAGAGATDGYRTPQDIRVIALQAALLGQAAMNAVTVISRAAAFEDYLLNGLVEDRPMDRARETSAFSGDDIERWRLGG